MPKILYFTEMEEFFGGDDWKLEINITDIWNKYESKELTIEQFNIEYKNRLLKYKSDIINISTDVWNKFVPLINNLNIKKTYEDSVNIYESIYDISDKNDILIKTK